MQVDRQNNDLPANPAPNITPAEWQAQVDQLRSANEVLQRQKTDAEKDRELFRDMYSKASAHAGEVIRENGALEERATLAEGQLRDGIAMIRSTYEIRISKLEEEVKKWKGLYELIVEKDQRTNGDELRRRAALQEELQRENAKLKEDLELLREDYEKMETVFDQLGEQELEKLQEQLEEEVKVVDESFNAAGTIPFS